VQLGRVFRGSLIAGHATEHNTPDAAYTAVLARCAICSGVPSKRWQCVTSRNASSTENTSMSGVIVVNASMMAVDTCA